MRTTPPLRRALQLCLLALAANLAPAQTTFTLTQLAPLDGYTEAVPPGITGAGQAIGYSLNSDAAATLWTGGTATALPTPGQYTWASPVAVNASGSVIVGFNNVDSGPALVWTWNGSSYNTATELPSLGSTGAYASSVNASGQIVGYSGRSGDAVRHAVSWTWNGSAYVATDLDPSSGTTSYANSLNSAGQIVGQIGSQAVIWNWNSGTSAYVATNLPDANSEARAINSAGRIAGQIGSQAAIWNWNGTSYDSGQTLPGLGGSGSSSADAINSAGHVVGTSPSYDYDTDHAFYYDGTMYDLNDYVTNLPSGWTLMYANGINDAGQIVGRAYDGSQYYGFLLTPSASAIPEPSTYAALAGALALALSAWHRKLGLG